MVPGVVDLCQQQGVSVAELVERSGLDDQRIQAIIDGRWTPSPQERERIAAVFGVDKGAIAWGHKTPIQHIYGHGPG